MAQSVTVEHQRLAEAPEQGIPWRKWSPYPRAALGGDVLVIGGVLLTGCAPVLVENAAYLFDQARRTLEQRQYVQELNNIARFLVEPEALPQYIQIQRGTIQSRPQPQCSLGTNTYIAGSPQMAIVWEMSVMTDPGDVERMRLLFQWVTKHISLDEFERPWGEIKDQPEFGTDAKQLYANNGRPVLGAAPLPISKDSSRDWYTTNQKEAAAGLDRGEYRDIQVWINDLRGAAMFALAVQRAIPNTKRRRRRAGRPTASIVS